MVLVNVIEVVCVGVLVGVYVSDGVKVNVGVKVLVGVKVIVGVSVIVGVKVIVGVSVTVGMGVLVDVDVSVGVKVAVGIDSLTALNNAPVPIMKWLVIRKTPTRAAMMPWVAKPCFRKDLNVNGASWIILGWISLRALSSFDFASWALCSSESLFAW